MVTSRLLSFSRLARGELVAGSGEPVAGGLALENRTLGSTVMVNLRLSTTGHSERIVSTLRPRSPKEGSTSLGRMRHVIVSFCAYHSLNDESWLASKLCVP